MNMKPIVCRLTYRDSFQACIYRSYNCISLHTFICDINLRKE